MAEARRTWKNFAQKITIDLKCAKGTVLSEATKLRDDVMIWSDGYAHKIETLVKSGDFGLDSKNSSSTTQSSIRRK